MTVLLALDISELTMQAKVSQLPVRLRLRKKREKPRRALERRHKIKSCLGWVRPFGLGG